MKHLLLLLGVALAACSPPNDKSTQETGASRMRLLYAYMLGHNESVPDTYSGFERKMVDDTAYCRSTYWLLRNNEVEVPVDYQVFREKITEGL